MIVAGQWGTPREPPRGVQEIDVLDASVREYRRGDSDHGLKITGWGNISIAIEWQSTAVVKPLPLFPSRTAFEAYASVLGKHFQVLADGNVGVLSTTLQGIENEHGGWDGWLVQPMISSGRLLPSYLRSVPRTEAVANLVELAAHITAVVSPRFGLDADITNWCVSDDGRLLLLD